MVIFDSELKTYNYFSRYRNLRTLYNTEEKKRYYETYEPLSKNLTKYITHVVKDTTETLDSISLKYYGTPLYWWIIADINNIENLFTLEINQSLVIPYLNNLVETV